MRKNLTITIPFLAMAFCLTLTPGAAWSQDQVLMTPGESAADESIEADWPEDDFQMGSLEITDEQKAKLKDLRQSFRKEQVQARADLRIQQMELRELMRAENPDRAAIAQKLDAIAAARTAQALARFDHRQQMLSILTPDQRDQLKKWRQERRGSRRFARRGRRGGRGFGRRNWRQRHWRPRMGRDCPCGMGPGLGDGPPQE